MTFAYFTSVIGKNDVGKSTLLEALEIFFNNKNPDSDDAHVQARNGGGAERSQNPDAGRRRRSIERKEGWQRCAARESDGWLRPRATLSSPGFPNGLIARRIR